MRMNRRFFLHKGALAVAGTTAMPNFLVRSVLAQAAGGQFERGQRLVVIFQRGAADGLNVVVPYREKNYYKMRPSIAIPQNEVLTWMDFSDCIRRWPRSSRCTTRGNWRLCTRAGSPDPSGRTLTRRITWSRGRRE
jgi:hypothetical protein